MLLRWRPKKPEAVPLQSRAVAKGGVVPVSRVRGSKSTTAVLSIPTGTTTAILSSAGLVGASLITAGVFDEGALDLRVWAMMCWEEFRLDDCLK